MTQLGPFDLSLVFQKLSEVMPNHFAAVDQVCIVFSPQQFKALSLSLAETIKGYEEVFGELTIPLSDIQPKKNAVEISEQIRSARQAATGQPAQEDKTAEKRSGKKN